MLNSQSVFGVNLQQKILLKVLSTHSALHLQGLFFEADTDHRNQNNKKKSCYETEEHFSAKTFRHVDITARNRSAQ